MHRQLVLTAYDVSDPRRLKAARARVSEWAHGGQKSVWECFAGIPERGVLGHDLFNPLDPRYDRLALLLPARDGVRMLGRSVLSREGPVIFVG